MTAPADQDGPDPIGHDGPAILVKMAPAFWSEWPQHYGQNGPGITGNRGRFDQHSTVELNDII